MYRHTNKLLINSANRDTVKLLYWASNDRSKRSILSKVCHIQFTDHNTDRVLKCLFSFAGQATHTQFTTETTAYTHPDTNSDRLFTEDRRGLVWDNSFLCKWDERGERPFLWPLTSFWDRHTYSLHSVQYCLSTCFEQFCWDLIRTCGFATCCLTYGTSNL